MERILFRVFLIILMFFVLKFNTEAQQPETRNLQAFNRVRVADNINVTLVPGNESKAVLHLKNIMNEKVLITVTNAELQLKTEGVFNNSDIHITVYYTEPLKKLTTTFGGLVRTDSVLQSDKLELDCRLDGFTNLLIDVNELKISAGQGSDVYVSGKANKTIIDATTGAKVRTETLISENADVKCVLGAKVWLNVRNNFKARAVSGGKIYYSVHPAGDFKKSWSTGGEILQQ